MQGPDRRERQLGERSGLDRLLAALEGRRTITRRLEIATGRASYDDILVPPLSFNGETLVTRHGLRYRLLIIGAAQTARPRAWASPSPRRCAPPAMRRAG